MTYDAFFALYFLFSHTWLILVFFIVSVYMAWHVRVDFVRVCFLSRNAALVHVRTRHTTSLHHISDGQLSDLSYW